MVQELVVGGLDTSQHDNGMYGVTKILAFDDFAVQIYSEEFDTKPTEDLNSKELFPRPRSDGTRWLPNGKQVCACQSRTSFR